MTFVRYKATETRLGGRNGDYTIFLDDGKCIYSETWGSGAMNSFAFEGALAGPRNGLGPAGPFPAAALTDTFDRRWLHYAFLSRDGRHAMVANAAWLGPVDDEEPPKERFTTILLLHERGQPWSASQFNADIGNEPWSAFRLPHPHFQPYKLGIAASAGTPRVDLDLVRTSRPCSSQCAFFHGGQHLRWQSETGVRGSGRWDLGNGPEPVDLIGYHERVRGRWRWPDLGEWVFGFANDLGGDPGRPPAWAGVFTFIRPATDTEHATASFMLWKDGRMRRHFPRRNVSFAVRGELDRDKVTMTPPLARLLGVPPMAPVPKRLAIVARQGDDVVMLDFDAEAAARVVIPSENSIRPFSVNEVVGDCLLAGRIGGEQFAIETRGIVEFAGGAGGD
ncbi:MAG: hypothetical protein JWO25_2551 [Alphaproteobacteria bacterium]|nr:hypothetical protein [Alphaproteobacteria bacterium]MDB5722899.1 hypothetical protein [Alphaproteobacteria bacterium]